MKNRLVLILAIYSVAGLLALDLHAASDDDIVGPPTIEDEQPTQEEEVKPAPAPRQRPNPKPAPRQQPPRQQEEPGDHDEIDRDADGEPSERPNRPNRPNRAEEPNYPRGPRVEWLKIACPQARVEFFDFGDSWSHCYVEGTRRRYEVMLDSTGIEFGIGGFGLEIKHTPGSDISGYYTGDGASIGLPLGIPVGGAGGKFYQIPKRRGDRPLNRATLVGAQFGLGFSVIDGIRIRRAR